MENRKTRYLVFLYKPGYCYDEWFYDDEFRARAKYTDLLARFDSRYEIKMQKI